MLVSKINPYLLLVLCGSWTGTMCTVTPICFIITDVIGVCKSVEEVTRLTTKTNREVSKRTLNLMDMSAKVVTVTLWGEEVSTDSEQTQASLCSDILIPLGSNWLNVMTGGTLKWNDMLIVVV